MAYDGTEFHGFQRQRNARSVQEVIEDALKVTCGDVVGVSGAGRTDAGVHATGQVIAFSVNWSHTLSDLHRALNVRLPDDVAVLDLAECGAVFHPRFSARSRTYEYTVVFGAVRQPLLRRYAWVIERDLDVAAMNEAAAVLIGEHDFAAFGVAPKGDVTVRRVVRAEWQMVDSPVRQSSSVAQFTIEANAFLFRMVRHMVRALVRVGRGQLSVGDMRDILASRDSQRIKGIAPACGLSLVKVTY